MTCTECQFYYARTERIINRVVRALCLGVGSPLFGVHVRPTDNCLSFTARANDEPWTSPRPQGDGHDAAGLKVRPLVHESRQPLPVGHPDFHAITDAVARPGSADQEVVSLLGAEQMHQADARGGAVEHGAILRKRGS